MILPSLDINDFFHFSNYIKYINQNVNINIIYSVDENNSKYVNEIIKEIESAININKINSNYYHEKIINIKYIPFNNVLMKKIFDEIITTKCAYVDKYNDHFYYNKQISLILDKYVYYIGNKKDLISEKNENDIAEFLYGDIYLFIVTSHQDIINTLIYVYLLVKFEINNINQIVDNNLYDEMLFEIKKEILQKENNTEFKSYLEQLKEKISILVKNQTDSMFDINMYYLNNMLNNIIDLLIDNLNRYIIYTGSTDKLHFYKKEETLYNINYIYSLINNNNIYTKINKNLGLIVLINEKEEENFSIYYDIFSVKGQRKNILLRDNFFATLNNFLIYNNILVNLFNNIYYIQKNGNLSLKFTEKNNFSNFISYLINNFYNNRLILTEKQLLEIQLIINMCTIIESKDDSTGDHVKRVSLMIYKFLQYIYKHYKKDIFDDNILLFNDNISLDNNLNYQLLIYGISSSMHDIGKISIPDHILYSRNKLNYNERNIIEKHTTIGSLMLSFNCNQYNYNKYDKISNIINYAKVISLYHHERWDGYGYPFGIDQMNISFIGRITAIIDNYDALMFKRIYKQTVEKNNILQYIQMNSGSKFDPELTNIFIQFINDSSA